MKRALWSAVIIFGCVLALHGQSAFQPRRILFDTFVPIAARILPSDERVVVTSAQPGPDVAWPEEGAFVATIVRKNPIIFTGRVVVKQPVFMRLFAGQAFTEVPFTQANWIGSRITVLIDGIVHTVDELPLTLLQRLTFIDDGDGTATVNGVRIDTVTPSFEAIEQDRRYLVTGRLRGGAFSPSGMWMEPSAGGIMRPRLRKISELELRSPFDEWTVDEAAQSLASESRRQAAAR